MTERDVARAVEAPEKAEVERKDPGYWGRISFLAPLIFTGLMMTTDTPIVNAVISRLPDGEIALAAMVVGFSLALVYEAPHISMLEVGTKLATSRQALRALRRFYVQMTLAVAAIGALVVFTPLYDLLLRDVMNITPQVSDAVRPALAVFLLWPAPIGWRRLHQGALIRYGQSRAVGAGATIRIVALVASIVLLALFFGQVISGAVLGVMAMVISVTAEAVYNERAANRLLADIPETNPDQTALQFAGLWEYFWPLAGTALISTLNRPLISAGIAAAALASGEPGGPDSALAAYGVAWSIVFLFNGGTLTLWPVTISWDNEPDPISRRKGIVTIMAVGAVLSALIALIAFTPLLDWLMTAIYTVTPDIARAAEPVVLLLSPLPVLFAASGILRGRLVNRGYPRAVRRVQIINLGVWLAVFLIGINWPDAATRPYGATLAALAALIAYGGDVALLAWMVRSTRRAGRPAVGKL